MLQKKIEETRQQVKFISIEELVPQGHILREIERSMDFTFIYELVKGLYSEDKGRPSIDPVSLIKIVMVQHLFGIRSMRQTIREIEVNVAYRWFIGYDLLEPIPHFTTFGKNYIRRFKDTDIFEQIFTRILEEAVMSGFVKAEEGIFIDATHIKASANKKKLIKKEVEIQAKHYHKQLMEEVNSDREEHGKKPFDDNSPPPDEPKQTKIVVESKTDPESGMFYKTEKENCFAYTAHVACDRNNFILESDVSAGNVHDSVMFDKVFNRTVERFPDVSGVAVDAGYKTPWIMKQITDAGMLPASVYKRPMTKEGFFKKYEYVYDEYFDCMICPDNKILKYSTTNREGYREYKSDPRNCRNCPYRMQCTHSKNMVKVVTRHVWDDYMEYAEDVRHSPEGKALYSLRSQTIERVFADAKEKHGMRYTNIRGLTKMKDQVKLVFSCMNLKKLAAWKRKNGLLPPSYPFSFAFFQFFSLFKKEIYSFSP